MLNSFFQCLMNANSSNMVSVNRVKSSSIVLTLKKNEIKEKLPWDFAP